jgi:tetratricopeptide (TPR) repeat protein
MPISPMNARRGIVAAALLVLAACAAAPERGATTTPRAVEPESLLAEGDAALGRGELPEAARAYRLAAEASGDETVAEQATRVAFENFQFGEAARSADRWLALNPTTEQGRRYAGIAALELHRLDAAEAHFTPLLETAYVSPAAGFLALLPVIVDEGSAPDVTELFRRLAARYPSVAEGQQALGSAALRSENFALAQRSAERAIELAPYWTPPKMLLARALIASGKDEEGLAIARDVVMAPDSDAPSHLEYGLLLASTGRDAEARALLTPYATGKTVIPGAVRSLGLMDLQSGDLDAAGTRFEQLLKTGTQSYEAFYYQGVIAERRKDPVSAQRHYGRVTAGDHALAAQQRVARIVAEESSVEAGLAHLEEFARSHSSLGPDIVAARAGLLSSFGDDRRSLEVLDDGLAQYPDVFDLRMARVFAYERAGKGDAAVRDLRRLLADRPADPVVQNALGYTLADQDRQLDEAQALIAAALEQTPDSAAVLDSMGWVLHRRGQDEQALSFLLRAQQLTDEAEIDLHVGEVQWALGDQATARRTWGQALERHPGNRRLEERLERAGK